jgi:hypothetical protein
MAVATAPNLSADVQKTSPMWTAPFLVENPAWPELGRLHMTQGCVRIVTALLSR